MPRLLMLVLALAAAAVGCGDDGGGGAAVSESALNGVPWVVTSGLTSPGWEQVAPSTAFADGHVAGSSGCNRYNAAYKVDGDMLEIGQVAGTMRACGEPADTVETEFLQALDAAATWRADGGELVLADGDGKELLRFEEASPVGSWEATSFLTEQAVTSPLLGTTITAEFRTDGTLSGNAGCDDYTTTYTRSRGRLTIAAPGATRKRCSEPDGIMEQEQAYLDALPQTRGYELEGSSLTLLTAAGTIVATYTRASEP